ncbi:DUF456 domain-containing protein [Aestuariimicrobium ganziense]|uniref:DUF456 domain-containing protein n=1 Tax=Aestuariimicrobium ganziense TaxID=2773677 RepID=UPI001940D3AF|nr:DUF456 domain-containing protein [Aestuariimicrobium ganziense]
MPADLAAIVAVLLAIVGVVGIVVPVLPGSITIVVALLVWAVWGGSAWGWVAFAVGTVAVLAGATASFLLTKRNLEARAVPKWPLRVSLLVGVVANFLLPALGLVIGFLVTLLVCEWLRVRTLREALSTSWLAVRSIGLGMIIELGCALFACTLLAISILTSLVI